MPIWKVLLAHYYYYYYYYCLGKPSNKKTVKKGDIVHTGGGQPQFPFLAQIYRNLPGPQITQKLTLDTLEIQFFVTFFCHF